MGEMNQYSILPTSKTSTSAGPSGRFFRTGTKHMQIQQLLEAGLSHSVIAERLNVHYTQIETVIAKIKRNEI